MFIGLLSCFGCSELDVLTATFADELVESQARTVALKVVDNADCDALSRVEHAQIESVANVIATRSTGYPINPESGVLENLPRGRPLVFDLSALDGESRQIARACQGVTLPNGDQTEVMVDMLALPTCTEDPTGLDGALVLDASVQMRFADVSLGSELVERLSAFFESGISAGGDRWTLIVHGPTVDPEVTVPLTSDRSAIVAGIAEAGQDFSGASRLFDAARLGTIALRARAVCGRRPVLLVVSAGFDAGPRGGRELAIAGLVGDRTNPDDDLFGLGIAVSAEGKESLDLFLVDNLGESQVALTGVTLSSALARTRDRLQGLVGL